MRVGDSLYCHSVLNLIQLRVGKVYIIDRIDIDIDDGRFEVIIDEIGSRYYFSYGIDNVNRLYYYKKFFYTLKEYRKLKLDFLGKSSLIERSSICESIIGTEVLG